MSGHTPEDPITLEVRRLQRPMAGRRLLSWLLFLAGGLVFLVAPLLASLHGGDAAALRDLPVLGAMFADAAVQDEARTLGRRPDPHDPRVL